MRAGNRACRLAVAAALAAGGAAWTHAAIAAGSDDELDEIHILGTRRAIDPTETVAPVDIIDAGQFASLGDPDMDNALRSLVPSFNVNQQPISDESSLIRPANLRGLPPDNTLVLVNGKRRHRSAAIGFQAGDLSKGAQGPDVGPIPVIALKQVQVLRDGAAAQYGSDAIAGVINYELRDNAEGLAFDAKFGRFYEGDGATLQLAGNLGLPLGATGFANFSLEYGEADPTDRAVQRSSAQALIDTGYAPYVENVPVPAMVWGQPEVKKSVKFFANLGYTIGEAAEIYAFGNYGTRRTDGGFFFRDPTARAGVFDADDSGEALLVADAVLAGGGEAVCPVIPITDLIPDQTQLARISAGGELADECFSFVEMFPGGFTPRFGGTVDDFSIAGGVRGTFPRGLTYDASLYRGRSSVDYLLYNSVNPSYGPQTPTSFRPGINQQTDTNFNLDFSWPLAVSGFASPLNAAFGFEARREEWKIGQGDFHSWSIGPYANQGFSTGSNGYPGYGPQSAGRWKRDNIAVYTDFEADVTERLTLGTAVRWEDFDDFGTTTNWKLSGRFDFTGNFGVRATASTGFRAPTPGQANTVKTTTAIIGGVLTEVGTLPPTNPITAALAGVLTDGAITATPLNPEKSTNWTVGITAAAGPLDFTLDYFHIRLKDRIALSSDLTVDRSDPQVQAILDELAAEGVPGVSQLSQFNFFTNDFQTTTRGVDLVASLPFAAGGGDSSLSLAVNWTDTRLRRNTLLVEERRETNLEGMLPRYRATLTGTHRFGPWSFLARASWYDKFRWDDYEGWEYDETYGAQLLVDAEAAYAFSDAYTVSIGAQNLFDSYPDEYPEPDGGGYRYPWVAPAGFNGGFWYLRLNARF